MKILIEFLNLGRYCKLTTTLFVFITRTISYGTFLFFVFFPPPLPPVLAVYSQSIFIVRASDTFLLACEVNFESAVGLEEPEAVYPAWS